jgi:hypothetical protein
MKTLAVVLSSALLMAGLVTGAVAQAPAPDAKPSGDVSTAPAPGGDPKGSGRADDKRPDMGPTVQGRDASPAPGADRPRSPDVTVNNRTEVKPGTSDDVAASPRTSVEETRIFGLSPTAAVLVAAGIILVLIMGIIALSGSRSDTTHIDVDRRL